VNVENTGIVTNKIRQPAVAGMFYPADPAELKDMVTVLIGGVDTHTKIQAPCPKAIIAPHAGYSYSGAVAASAYVRVAALRGKIAHVVLFGPSHRVPLMGFAASSAEYFATPLGNIPIDVQAVNRLLVEEKVTVLDQAHTMEHSLEVHLPFLQIVLKDFSLAPIVVGDAPAEAVSQLLADLWDGPETLIVVSSDLSHFHDYETAQTMDRKTCIAIENLDYRAIHSSEACGYIPVRGLLHHARHLGLQAVTVDYRNSGDTAGSKDQVVGYGAYAFG